MTTTDLPLDQNKIADLEPFEGDEHNSRMLSPFAVPQFVRVEHSRDGSILGLSFVYVSKEDIGTTSSLDDLPNPTITVVASKYTQKVLSLHFDRPVLQADLLRIAARLRSVGRPGVTQSTARRLSYQMTAAVIDAWGHHLFMADG